MIGGTDKSFQGYPRLDALRAGVVQKALNYITEEMGIVLRNSSVSPNIRERLDMSCALLMNDGRVASQAEHIPVHLGSLAWAAPRLLKKVEDLVENIGDIVIVNDPYITGTHLNDVTLITKSQIGWVVNKAHHVDVGGPRAGSLNPDAHSLFEEGEVIEPEIIAKSWTVDENALRELASKVRNKSVFMADIKAQIASLREGVLRLEEVIEKYGREKVVELVDYYIDHLASLYRETLSSKLEGYKGIGESVMETPSGDAKIVVKIVIRNGILYADFSDTSDQLPNNMNAVEGVAYAATSFLVKALTKPEDPINHALYSIFRINTRLGSILNPRYPAAVGAGNLETSQRALEALALSLANSKEVAPSAGPGTMANLVLSTDTKVYYETNGGGGSSTFEEDGENAVQWGMTNTMNTPVEILEQELPLLFVEYKVRRGSGGRGRRRGGDGIVKSFKSLSKISATVIMSRIRYPSPGIDAEPGKPGKITVTRGNDKIELGGFDSIDLLEGDIFTLETPGAGGHS